MQACPAEPSCAHTTGHVSGPGSRPVSDHGSVRSPEQRRSSTLGALLRNCCHPSHFIGKPVLTLPLRCIPVDAHEGFPWAPHSSGRTPLGHASNPELLSSEGPT